MIITDITNRTKREITSDYTLQSIDNNSLIVNKGTGVTTVTLPDYSADNIGLELSLLNLADTATSASWHKGNVNGEGFGPLYPWRDGETKLGWTVTSNSNLTFWAEDTCIGFKEGHLLLMFEGNNSGYRQSWFRDIAAGFTKSTSFDISTEYKLIYGNSSDSSGCYYGLFNTSNSLVVNSIFAFVTYDGTPYLYVCNSAGTTYTANGSPGTITGTDIKLRIASNGTTITAYVYEDGSGTATWSGNVSVSSVSGTVTCDAYGFRNHDSASLNQIFEVYWFTGDIIDGNWTDDGSWVEPPRLRLKTGVSGDTIHLDNRHVEHSSDSDKGCIEVVSYGTLVNVVCSTYFSGGNEPVKWVVNRTVRDFTENTIGTSRNQSGHARMGGRDFSFISADAWSSKTAATTAKWALTYSGVEMGNLLWVYGGRNSSHLGDGLPNLDRYSIFTDGWQAMSSRSHSKYYGNGFCVEDELHYMGGISSNAGSATYKHGRYVDSTATWTELTSSILNIVYGALGALDGFGMVHTASQYTTAWTHNLTINQRYDRVADNWTTMASYPQGASTHFAASTLGGYWYNAGGTTSSPSTAIRGRTYRYELGGDTWERRQDATFPFHVNSHPSGNFNDNLITGTWSQRYNPVVDQWYCGALADARGQESGAVCWGRLIVTCGNLNSAGTNTTKAYV